MVWTGISWRGKTELRFISGNMDAMGYNTMLESALQPFIEDYYPEGLIFQQDGAPAHRANTTMDYFFDIDAPLLDWAPCFQNMNIIENCWGFLTQAVYRNGRQFETENDLQEALTYEWEKLPLDYIRKLVLSMNRRVKQLWTRKGRETDY